MARWLDASANDFPAEFARLRNSKREAEEDVSRSVKEIIARVRADGDAALIAYSRRFDKAELTLASLRVSPTEIEEAEQRCSREAREALLFAAGRIEAYHRRQLPANEDFTDAAGVRLGWRWGPLQSAGLYVPGGTASYPSSVLMNAIPAKVAGVARIVMTTPASGGTINPLTLAAAKLAGVSEIYRIGGAQAVAALAYGTGTIAPVDKIAGPGNAYVAAAKREVFGEVGIDSIAGPSEVLVIADGQNDPSWIAADLLAQAEHDASSQSILITDDAAFGRRVADAVAAQLKTLPRGDIARAAWDHHGAIIVVRRLEDAVPLADAIAPEHLEIATAHPEELFEQVKNAGAVFLGRYTPEAIGDYVAGPNHVLPTSRTARFSSGLSVLDYMKRTSVLSCDADALRRLGAHALALADAEGLSAHAKSIAIRLNAT